jgi:hypothetical protein
MGLYMSDEAQRIVDELADVMWTHMGGPAEVENNRLALDRLRGRILQAASKPKHPTPDQFIDGAGVYGLSLPTHAESVLKRQLDAANHAIAHLRAIVARGKSFSQAMDFLDSLDCGKDFPEMPK